MSRKQCKRRVRPIAANPMEVAMDGAQSVASHQRSVDLMLANRSAMDALRRGEASEDDMGALANALNIARALVAQRKALGRQYLPEINEAQEALLAIAKRAAEHSGRYVAKASELDAVVTAIDLHEQQLSVCGVVVLRKATYAVRGVIASGCAVMAERAHT